MAKLCVASPLLLLLLALLHAGSALHCYESMCLNDPNVNTCVNNNRTAQKECNVAVLRQNLNKLVGSGGEMPNVPTSINTWTCIKHDMMGTQNGQAAKIELKMCFPESPNACDAVTKAAKGLEHPLGGPQAVTRQCYACTGDSCNPAQRPAASLAAVLVTAAGVLLLRR